MPSAKDGGRLDILVRKEVQTSGHGLQIYLRNGIPLCGQSGVSFHLAETSGDPTSPFAFLARDSRSGALNSKSWPRSCWRSVI